MRTAATEARPRTPSRSLVPARVSAEVVVVGLIVSYFAFRLLCYATWFHPHLPPDEVDLFGRTLSFKPGLGIPEDSAATAEYGPIARRAWLYFWLLGKALWLNVFGIDELLFARYLNALLGVATLVLAYRCTGQFTTSKPARILVVAALSNTLQFSAMAATVTYDNLVNLIAVACTYYLFKLFREVTFDAVLKLLLGIALGMQTKISFLPLGVMYLVVLLVRRRRTLRQDTHALLAGLRRATRAQMAILALLVAFTAIDAEMYVGNVMRYGSIEAPADKVLPLELALLNRITRRDWVVEQYRIGKLSYEQALRELQPIKNAGNRARGVQLLNYLRDRDEREATLVSPELYSVLWTQIALERIIGFQGNGGYVLPPSRFTMCAVLLMMLFCTAMFVRRARSDDQDGVPVYAFWLCGAYAMLLMWTVTYPLYRSYGAIDNAVNGRYLFPVLPFLYAVGARYGVAVFGVRVQVAIAVLVSAVFVLSDMPYLIAHMGPCWFADAPPSAGCHY